MTKTTHTEPARLDSLDAFRGLTIAGMLLVNNQGRWSDAAQYPQLRHAAWHGCTFTDLVFPFFLFIVGVSIVFAFTNRVTGGIARGTIIKHVWRRAGALYLLGLFQSVFPFVPRGPHGFWAALADTGVGGIILRLGFVAAFIAVIALLISDGHKRRWLITLAAGVALTLIGSLIASSDQATWFWQHIGDVRLAGVLARIAACYVFASYLYLYAGKPWLIAAICIILLVAYSLWMLYVPVPGFGKPELETGLRAADHSYTQQMSNWAFYLDTHLLGVHAYHSLPDANTGRIIWAFDPEGPLSTVTSLCTVLLGILCGIWLKNSGRDQRTKTFGMVGAGVVLIGLGLLWAQWIPLNKRLWTSSYVVFTGGMALCWFGFCFALIEIRGRRLWARPFVWYGRNAITAFFFSSLAATMSVFLRVARPGDPTASSEGAQASLVPLKIWVFETVYLSWLDLRAGSTGYALGVVAVWALIAGLLYQRRIYLKI